MVVSSSGHDVISAAASGPQLEMAFSDLYPLLSGSNLLAVGYWATGSHFTGNFQKLAAGSSQSKLQPFQILNLGLFLYIHNTNQGKLQEFQSSMNEGLISMWLFPKIKGPFWESL